jgi:hypothetical protein
MKPKPFSWLNHFTVPVAIVPPENSGARYEGTDADACELTHVFFARAG